MSKLLEDKVALMKKKPVIRADPEEMHRSGRAGWLRAAVLGSDDAIVSTASLMIGVAASSASKGAILVAGVAGLVAGSMSMAVGEYVSVSSQRDAERADIGREERELAGQPRPREGTRAESRRATQRARSARRTHA
jgi:VIT1/CCC1 family predicted Fe2+/Mn2+ transporter